MNEKSKPQAFKINPNLDFLFGYCGDMQVPTKQDNFKPISAEEIQQDGTKILKKYYVRSPLTGSVKEFKTFIQNIAKKAIYNSKKIKNPNAVQVFLSISVNRSRYFDVDVDNLAKTVLDCLSGIAYDDDCQVSSLIVDKHIHRLNKNGILIGITKITNDRKGITFNW